MATARSSDAHSQPGAGPTSEPSATRPGEFSHYFVNLLTLFGESHAASDVERMAHAAVAHREREVSRFDQHLADLKRDFTAQQEASGVRADILPAPLLEGWDRDYLDALRQAHGGVLLALFHYGQHRQVLSDLAVLGVPFVAPVAKHAYFECNALATIAPPAFEAAMRLVEVEDPRVGRVLLGSLRKGRIGLIYVDGNMGPDGHLVEEGGVEVRFFQRRIRVKAGIARLSQSLGLPVLPVCVSPTASGSRVGFGRLVMAPARDADPTTAEASRARMMQAIYGVLEAEVRRDPVPWEFAFCLHRWLLQPPAEPATDASAAAATAPARLEATQKLSISLQHVTVFDRDEEQFWVHVGKQKAYRVPAWSRGLFELLQEHQPSVGQAERWLGERCGDDVEARRLLDGLVQRELIRA